MVMMMMPISAVMVFICQQSETARPRACHSLCTAFTLLYMYNCKLPHCPHTTQCDTLQIYTSHYLLTKHTALYIVLFWSHCVAFPLCSMLLISLGSTSLSTLNCALVAHSSLCSAFAAAVQSFNTSNCTVFTLSYCNVFHFYCFAVKHIRVFRFFF